MFVVFPKYYYCDNHLDVEGLFAADLRQAGEKRMASCHSVWDERKEEGKRRKKKKKVGEKVESKRGKRKKKVGEKVGSSLDPTLRGVQSVITVGYLL
jgi:hypothetical protein